jgi:hypothetical protein
MLVAVSSRMKKEDMATLPTTSTKLSTPVPAFTQSLDHEAGDLAALHEGLVQHLTSWREAHEAAILRLGAVMARIDAMVERIERN